MKLYMLSGLGADRRIFERLSKHLPELEIVALDWLPPGDSRSLAEYAALYHQKFAPSPPFMLGGVSMGGMVAQEWARLSAPDALVLISTACHRSDFPWPIRLAHRTGITRLLQKPFLVWLGTAADRFTTKTPRGRSLFYDMLHDADPDVMHFGARATSGWKPCGTAVPVLRIHGTADRVFPIRLLKTPAQRVKGGSHFMIVDRVGEIAEIMRRELVGKV